MTNVVDRDAAIGLCAAGEAAWHAAAYAGLGAIWTLGAGIAWAPLVPHRFLLGGVTLVPRPAVPAQVAGEIRDSWAQLDLSPTRAAQPADPWMLRPQGVCSVPEVPGIEIRPTRDAELFEHASFVAVTGKPPETRGELHPAGSQAAPGLHLLLAWRGELPVGTALAAVHDTGVVVSAVSVLAAERGCGIGARLTAAAVNCAPDRPATLSTSRLGEGVYRRLGFETVGRPLDWKPLDSGAVDQR